jgi:hypothetical protein
MKINFKTRYGVVKYTDLNANTDPMIMSYKGKSPVEDVFVYAPYIPLQFVSSMEPNRIVTQGEVWGWTTFIVGGAAAEVIQWCQENFGKEHRGIYLAGLNLWLGNGGKWRHDGRSLGEIGVVSSYVRIWLYRDDDITLFKLRWA